MRAGTHVGEFAPYRIGGAALEMLGENGYRECWRVCDQQVDVVGFAVELDQFDALVEAHTAHGVLGEGERGVGEQFRRFLVTKTRWTCRQPNRAGCIVRTSMSRRSPAVVHSTQASRPQTPAFAEVRGAHQRQA